MTATTAPTAAVTAAQLGVRIDAGGSLAPFEQLRDGIIARITAGRLAPGTKLPPVRALAAELDLAAGTVARAYKELEAAGFVETRGRGGTVVASTLSEPEAHERALALTSDYVAAMSAIGIERDRLADYLRRV